MPLRRGSLFAQEAVMAMQVAKVEVWAGDVQDQVGGLAQVLEAIGGAGGSVECVIGRRQSDRPGSGEVFVTPVKGAKAQKAAEGAGLRRTPIPTLRIEGTDKPGLGGRMMRAIADAGVNVRGVSAAVLGNKFVVYIGFDGAEDMERAAKALKSVNAGGGKTAKKSAKRQR
jgi:hypothetical protein